VHLPETFINSLKGVTGFEKEAFENAHQTGEQVVSVRINPIKASIVSRESSVGTRDKSTAGALMNEELPTDDSANLYSSGFLTHDSRLTIHERVPWCQHGYYLTTRPAFTLDPLFHAGAYYVQEPSSMFLDYLLRQIFQETESLKVLDLCAAPGGKTTLLASLPFFKLIVANEIIKSRVSVLYENVVKWGTPHVIITNNDPKDFSKLTGFFDGIVIDAPCSGSGMFRKDPRAIEEWSEKNVNLCSERQQRILADAIPPLKEKGWLIYATCSYSKKENEEILDWLLGNFDFESKRIEAPADWGISETQSELHHAWGYRFYPNRLQGEGFFVSCMQKRSQEKKSSLNPKPPQTVKKEEKNVFRKWMNNDHELEFLKLMDQFFAIPAGIWEDFLKIQTVLAFKKRGIKLGSIYRGELVPNHELALSTIISPDLPFRDLPLEKAMQYLRKQSFSLDSPPRGWVLTRYNGLNLGWIKVLLRRINNYYPLSWRILKQ
jgi:16S rRNA C967 or C1407 C5-methylase (RsmB/RsmF family)/NOL1/NOP2/fmu family ribosome biogenesis protein